MTFLAKEDEQHDVSAFLAERLSSLGDEDTDGAWIEDEGF